MKTPSEERLRKAVLSGHPFGGPLRERWHLGGRSGSLRAAVFGMSDGLVSNLALILGVAGSGVHSNVVVVAGVAGLLAGAFSMGVGEYISMRIQREIFEHTLSVESAELELLPEQEQAELVEIYVAKGIPRETAVDVAAALMADPVKALDVHAREELGLDPGELGSPMGAALSSFGTFSIGAIVPLLPYVFGSGTAAFVGAIVAGAVALGLVGGGMAALTRRSVPFGAFRLLALGTVTATATFLIGSLFNVSVA